MMEVYTLQSTSANSAEADPIVLRETEQRRLVFKPQLVKKPGVAKTQLDGTFVYQRKRQHDRWEDHNTLPLNKLRADEWVRIELNSHELNRFLRHMGALWRYCAQGMPRGRVHLLKVDMDDARELEHLKLNTDKILRLAQTAGFDLLGDFMDWLVGAGDPGLAMQRLAQLDQSSVEQLGALAQLSRLKQAREEWNSNLDCGREEYWQKTLEDNSFVLSQLVSHPLIVVFGKAYIGGKAVDNRGGHLADYLAKNPLTENAAIVEIKTPTCRLLSNTEYRNGVFSPSDDLVGAVNQLLTYRQSLIGNQQSLRIHEQRLSVFRPQCLLIAGTVERELDTQEKRRSFELFRHELKDVLIVTFDELIAKLDALIEVLLPKHA